MVQIIERETPFGKLSENFGKSLGEVAGEGLERQALGAGVSKLSDQLSKSGTFDRTKLISGLSRIPGMTPELMGLYFPALENSLRLNALENKYGAGAAEEAAQGASSGPILVPKGDEEEELPLGVDPQAPIPIQQTNAPTANAERTPPPSRKEAIQKVIASGESLTNEAINQTHSDMINEWKQASQGAAPSEAQRSWVEERTTFDEGVSGLLTREEEGTLRKGQYVPSPEDRDRGALQIYKENPGRFGSINEAYDFFDKQVQAQNQKLGAEQQRIGSLQQLDQEARNKIDSRITEILGKEGLADTWKTMPPSIQQRVKNNALKDLRDGSTTDEVAQKSAREVQEFSRNFRDFIEIPDKALFGNGSQEDVARMDNYRDIFAKYGAIPEYVGLLRGKGQSPHTAAAMGYGYSPDVIEQMDTLKVVGSGPGVGASAKFKESFKESANKPLETFSETLSASISEADSIDAIALSLGSKGYDTQKFYELMQERAKAGDFKPSSHQEEELRRRAKVNKIPLGDLMAGMIKESMVGPATQIF